MTSTYEEGLSSDRVRGPLGLEFGDIQCSICHNVLWKPVACQPCETPFCSACIAKWLSTNPNKCPIRCEEFIERSCPQLVAKQLAKLQIVCIYQPNGCNEVVLYEALDEHEAQCGHQPQQCSGCQSQISKKDLTEHEAQCPWIESTCGYCKIVYKRRDTSACHSDVICLREQLRQLRHESQEEIQQLKEQLEQSQQKHKRELQKLHQDCEEHMRQFTRIGMLSPPLRGTDIRFNLNARWAPNGVTVAGGNGEGHQLNQLYFPAGLYVDDDQTVYVADGENARIVEWKCDATSGQVIAGGNGQGNRMDQLHRPTDVIVDQERDSLIICDLKNKRVMRWPRRGGTSGEIIISGIDCWGLTMDDRGFVYVCDIEKHDVQRWRVGDTQGTVVAGGHGQGDRVDQLNSPKHVFIHRDHSVYVSDTDNNRVMKWMEGAKEGIVVAGGRGEGNDLTQLSHPRGVVVDQMGTVYVADSWNHRIMRWPKRATQGSVIVGGNSPGEQANELNHSGGLSFDRHGNLCVVDCLNARVQKFQLDLNCFVN